VPKKEYRILGFHGGLNDHSDAKDIRDIDLKSATGVSVHRIGRLVGIGNNTNTAVNSSEFTADIEPGYGLHYFSTDVNNAETKTSEDWLAIYDKANTKVRLYYRDKVNNNASPGFSSEEITFSGNIKANYYYADGMLRIGDAGHNERSKWFGYIDNDLFWTNQYGTINLHDINKWSNGDQRLLPVSNLIGEDYFNLVDLSSANPDATTIGDGTQIKLILGYWTTEGGEWSGNYSFGCTFIYEGDQESALSVIYDDALNEIETTANFYEEQVMFQVFIPMGTSSTIATDASHRLGDDRIIGLNWYFKQQGEDEDWIFLMHTDLKEGGKHHWKAYNATAETSYGYWDGEVVNDGLKDSVTEGVDILLNSSTPATHIAFWDNSNGTNNSPIGWKDTGTGASTSGLSYSNVYLEVNLNNNNINGFNNRYGFLRVWGGAISPLYVNSALDSSANIDEIALKTGQDGTPGTDWDTYFVPMVLPGPGTDREFRVEVLDENFAVIADSEIKTMTIADSGKEAPPDYEQEVEI